MIVYHGGTDIVRTPRILQAFTGRDFGTGFYTTDIRDQAIKWAKRQARYRRKDEAILNTYELSDSARHLLKTKSFDGYAMDWLDFVVENRSNPNFSHSFDIVIGNIANDNVGETVSYVVQGIITKEIALERLKFEKINNQVCFNTINSLKYLKYIGHTESWED